MADERPEQLFCLTRDAPKSDRTNRQAQKPKASLIYRKGARPQWVDSDESSDEDLSSKRVRRLPGKKAGGSSTVNMGKIERGARRAAEPVVVKTRTIKEATVVTAKEEPGSDSEGEAEVKPEKDIDIDLSKLEIPEGPEESSEEEDSDSDVDDRREQMRRRKLQKMKEEEERQKEAKEKAEIEREDKSDEDEDDDSSEYESESESSEPQRPMLKPVFVSKRQRQTIAERARMEAEEAAYEEELKMRDKERKEQAKKLVIEQLKLEEEAKQREAEEEMPDDTDGINEEQEIKAWKLRELRRIKRDAERREAQKKELAEIEKRRNMTDEQIMALNRKNKSEKDRGNMKFLQKYFHKGAFFQDEDHEIFKRDFNAATGTDAEIDRTRLPKVLQVKKFGLMGRTKYTHLVDQDTTFASKSKHELMEEAREREKVLGKRRLAGTGRVDDAFKRKRSKKEASSNTRS